LGIRLKGSLIGSIRIRVESSTGYRLRGRLGTSLRVSLVGRSGGSQVYLFMGHLLLGRRRTKKIRKHFVKFFILSSFKPFGLNLELFMAQPEKLAQA
jgi:hypothetical protein